jgi:hypothetical protein
VKIATLRGGRLLIANHLDQAVVYARPKFAAQHPVHKYWPKAILLAQTGINFILLHAKHTMQCISKDVNFFVLHAKHTMQCIGEDSLNMEKVNFFLVRVWPIILMTSLMIYCIL